MTSKLKIGGLSDDKPVKVTHDLSASVHRDLVAYGKTLAAQTGQQVDPLKLIDPMLARFMATDRAFRKARKGTTQRGDQAILSE